MEIHFQSRWFERCIKTYLGVSGRALTEEDVQDIKYLYVSTTDGYFIGFGKEELPPDFVFSDAGDEWDCCCLSDTGSYHSVEDFIQVREWEGVRTLEIKRALLEEENQMPNVQSMEAFERSVQIFEPVEEDFEGLVRNEETYDYGILTPEDFAGLPNLEAVRLMSCETEIHSLAFLNALPRLRVLESGQVHLNTLEGLDRLIGLEKLCIWSN